MTNCLIPVSIGELFDKYSILEIKKNKIKDNENQKIIQKEIEYLKIYIEKYEDLINSELYYNLKAVNEKLWNIEDLIREKEQKKEFDNEFIDLARSVYYTNDKRSKIKKEINIKLKSDIFEIKNYSIY